MIMGVLNEYMNVWIIKDNLQLEVTKNQILLYITFVPKNNNIKDKCLF
ncbi:hypothetical protein PMI10_00600 [Flavobacterium sp. CF136]|nr:hypothetical protein PMI10_00600 [Flavobacterium sp. CF136]